MDKSAGIEIENIPVSMTREELVELFKKELKNENEVNYILFPLPENRYKAFVCFKHRPDKAFIDRLLASNPLWSIKVDSRKQTYCCCTAEVDALIVASIPDIPACTAMLQKDYGIEASYDEDSGKFVLKGMLHQLQCAQNRLDNIFEEQKMLQGLELLQVGKSDDMSVKRPWLDYKERQDVLSSTTSVTDYLKESAKDVQTAKRSLLVDDQFESVPSRQHEEWNWFSKESDYRSLPNTSSFLHDDRSVTERGTRHYEHDPKSLTASGRTLPSVDLDRSDRGDEPTSLPHFRDEASRYAEDLPRTGDHRFSTQFEWRDRVGHPSLPEYTSNSDRLFSDRHAGHPTYARDKGDTFTHSRTSNEDWHKERGYPPGQSDIHREYQSTYTRTSPISDVLPSQESVSREDSTFTARIRSLNSDQHVSREEADVDTGSRHVPAFWKERQDVDSERLHSLPLFPSEVSSSRLDHSQYKDPGGSTFSRTETSFTTSRPRYLTDEKSDRHRDFGEDLDKPFVTTPENQTTLFLETYVVKYVVAMEKWSVRDIKQRYKVDIKVSTELGADFSTVIFYGKHMDQVEKASEKFAKLYEETFNGIIQREVSVNANLPEVGDVLDRVQTLYRVILITDVPGTVTIVGEFRDVMKAVDMLNGVQSEIEARDQQQGSGKYDVSSSITRSSAGRRLDLEETLPRRKDSEKITLSGANEVSRFAKQLSKSPDVTEDLKSSSIERSFRNTKETSREAGDVKLLTEEPQSFAVISARDSTRYTMTFKDNFQVFIYMGDITKLRVDAIVNAANSYLKNYAGVAGAIEDAGGPQFRKDCDNLFFSIGPLKVSHVAHTAGTGDLRCHNVIHTVGPQWYLDSDEDRCAADLLTTFKNVLSYAEKTLEATSLALPAVGTGIYGIPVDVCARAIYGAVHEFLEHSSSSSSPLKSLHVVNKDPGTTELIQAVFEGLRQLELERQTKTAHSGGSPSDDEKLSETSSSFHLASDRRRSERERLDSANVEVEKPGRDQTRTLTELRRHFRSHSRSDIDDDSESHVVQHRVTGEPTGPPEAADVASKQGFQPIADSDSDEF